MERRDRHPLDDPFAHVAPEARGMVGGDADVLVHVEAGDARPVDGVVEHERVEERRAASCRSRTSRARRRGPRSREQIASTASPRGGCRRARPNRRRRARAARRPWSRGSSDGRELREPRFRRVRASRRSSRRAGRSRCGRRAGRASIASTTLSRLPVTAASTVSSCDADDPAQPLGQRGRAAAPVAAAEPLPSATQMLSTAPRRAGRGTGRGSGC